LPRLQRHKSEQIAIDRRASIGRTGGPQTRPAVKITGDHRAQAIIGVEVGRKQESETLNFEPTNSYAGHVNAKAVTGTGDPSKRRKRFCDRWMQANDLGEG
jgi:hypothetical protein